MAVYDEFAGRHRIRAGAVIKARQNRIIFELGMAHCLAQERRVLDIGPGDGQIASLSHAAYLPYVAVEGSSAVTEMLRERGLEVHEGYVPPLPTGVAGRFSTCFLLHVLEHMPDHRAASQLFLQVHDTLLPSGTFVVACPDFARWGSDFYDCDYSHCFPVDAPPSQPDRARPWIRNRPYHHLLRTGLWRHRAAAVMGRTHELSALCGWDHRRPHSKGCRQPWNVDISSKPADGRAAAPGADVRGKP